MMPKAKTLDDIQKELQDIRPRLQDEFGISELKMFGSYARNDQTPTSDLDLAMSFHDEPPGLLTLLRIEHLVSDTLGVNVDLVVESTLKQHVKDTADRDMTAV